MAIKEAKVKAVEELRDKFSRSSTAIITDYRGLNVTQMTELRKKLKEQEIEYKVVKNNLTKIAIQDCDYNLDDFLKGPNAIAFSYEDPVAPAKILVDFAKTNKKLEIKAGVVEGKIASNDIILELAKMPSKEQLLASAVGAIQSPLYGIVGVLEGNLRNFVYTLQAIQNQKEA